MKLFYVLQLIFTEYVIRADERALGQEFILQIRHGKTNRLHSRSVENLLN